MKTFTEFLAEGVNDPAIFKAIFLAGGPGSGKSFVVKQTGLSALGFRTINSDNAFEAALKKASLAPTPENIYSELGQQIRASSVVLSTKQMELSLDGRLGLVIDGTGKNVNKVRSQVERLENLGYEVAMIFVNTDLETALARNRKRARSLPDEKVTEMWQQVQKNKGPFVSMFGQQFFEVDNSDGVNYQTQTNFVYRKISAWSKQLPKNTVAKSWVDTQRSMRKQFESLAESASCPVLTPAQLKAFENVIDNLFKKFNIDFNFTKHFKDRFQDGRNMPCITLKDLADMIKKIYKKKEQGKSVFSAHKDTEIVIKDLQTNINLPVVIDYDRKNDELTITAKTIMRKKNFATTSPVVNV